MPIGHKTSSLHALAYFVKKIEEGIEANYDSPPQANANF